MIDFILSVLTDSWDLLLESSVYVIFGLLVGGILRAFLNPGSVARHLGTGRFKSVFTAAFMGIPLPLCSCGVLPAAVSLKKQGADKGAVTAFMISTPESGVDSIAITWALLDPIMTIARPVAAFVTAAVAGISENFLGRKTEEKARLPDLTCPVDGCCDGMNCSAEEHKNHHTLTEKIRAGLKFAVTDVWSDMAVWFFFGLLLAGVITTLIPEDVFSRYLGGGLSSMLLILVIGIPLYICATASTPIAAALILKGVSPGAALVFLLVGPATNITSLTVLLGVLGKRATAIYFVAVASCAVLFGLAVDQVYLSLGISAQAMIGTASELFPYTLELAGAVILLLLSVKPIARRIKAKLSKKENYCGHEPCNTSEEDGSPLIIPNAPSCSSG